ncbi:permease [Caloranaerobacter azorensis H53214]|uniref:Probable membrane transporter protein n=1 Tax=Caloranaerobacter azorensis H53214 TaxID=1156417 RepID=A0A096CX56_9FIRM|nr:sulfite exporter TauE/SafE family protein [Caloranaerobacter azorensis]KGG81149.1 permease [Caloranaerobacter azorensis H53214]
MILFIIGFFSGIISGLGIGGGTILIPGLIFFTTLSQHKAQGINLLVFIPTAITALFIHFYNKNILLKIAFPIIITGLIGALIGSMIAVNINSEMLKKFFAIFLFFMGIYEFYYKKK